MVPTSWKTVLQFLKMVNIHLPLDPGIPLLEKKKKAYVCMKTYRWMFTAVLKVMAKNWNQPWHPSAGEWSPNGSVFIQWVQLNNEKDWPIDIGCSQQHRWPCTQSKKPDQKKKKIVHTVWFHLYAILENAKKSVMSESRSVGAASRSDYKRTRGNIRAGG